MKVIATLCLVFLSLNTILTAQDTTVVQTLEFSDITKRRGWYVFPPDTGSYRQVLMYYTLKCDPQTTQDGYDCGEWDYTTLTNAYTYEGVGTPYYTINGTAYDTIYYTAVPSYNYFESYQYFPNYLTTVSESDFNIGSGTANLTESISGNYQSHRSQYVILQSELAASGISAGDIHKLKLDFSLIGSDLNNLTIRLKNSALNELTPGSYENSGLQTVYQLNTNTVNLGSNTFNFVSAFNWDGTSNIVWIFLMKTM